jgi:hypothetical protein
MNARERIEATLQRRPHDRIPLVCLDRVAPRGDLEMALRERGMGLVLPRQVVWCEYPHVQLDVKTAGDIVTTVYRTPAGALEQRQRHNLGPLPDGRCATLDGLIKSPADYDAARFMAEDALWHLDNSTYSDVEFEIGGDGIVRCQGPRPAYEVSLDLYGGYHGAVQQRQALVRWAAEQERYGDAFSGLLAAIEGREERQLAAVLSSPVWWVSLGQNDGVLGPTRRREHVLPFYQRVTPQLHAAGKIASLHAHATNLRSFGGLIAETGVDVVEAFTPPPGGDLSLAEARQAWGSQVVIWVNLPDAVVWWPTEAIRRYVLGLVESDPHPEALMIGFTETGLLGIVDEESDAAYRRGLMAIADALDEVGTLS